MSENVYTDHAKGCPGGRRCYCALSVSSGSVAHPCCDYHGTQGGDMTLPCRAPAAHPTIEHAQSFWLGCERCIVCSGPASHNLGGRALVCDKCCPNCGGHPMYATERADRQARFDTAIARAKVPR
jgi:hypothetical protein